MKAHQWKSRSYALGQVRPTGAPAWVWGRGALESLLVPLSKLPGPYLIVGEDKRLFPGRQRITAWREAGLEIQAYAFPEGAECCRTQVDALLAVMQAHGVGTVIGWGGGKCLDSAKWAAHLAKLSLVTVPTSSATCACATQVVVEHSEAGEVLGIIDLDCPPALCAVDFDLLQDEPERLRKAGMADSLAKWIEWKAVEEPTGPGSEEARRSRDGVTDSKASREIVWEANLKLSALASNLGNAPAAAAHSFCAGISVLPASLAWLHGEWAGLGLRFQAKLLDEDDGELCAWLEDNSLLSRMPFSLDSPESEVVARKILAPDESIWSMPSAGRLDGDRILDAISAISK